MDRTCDNCEFSDLKLETGDKVCYGHSLPCPCPTNNTCSIWEPKRIQTKEEIDFRNWCRATCKLGEGCKYRKQPKSETTWLELKSKCRKLQKSKLTGALTK